MATSESTPSIPELLNQPGTSVAVVGATDDSAKYGSRIYRDLKAKGFTVFAVNPGRSSVDGDPSWPSLSDLPEAPTIVDFVVPPAVTKRVLTEALALGLHNVWIQPGAEDDEVMAFLEGNGFNHLANACIMLHSAPAA